MRSPTTRLFTCALLVSAVMQGQQPAPGVLTVRFSERAIEVGGATSAGNVVFFGVARELTGTTPSVRNVVRYAEIITDSDRDGIVRLEFPKKPVPKIAMWAVVDLSSGRHVATSTPGYEPRRIELTSELVKKDNAGQLRKIDWALSNMEVLLVRPGEGAWHVHVAKHSAMDENKGKPESLTLDVETMIAIGGSAAAPKHIKQGDVLAVMDSEWMQYGIVEVGK